MFFWGCGQADIGKDVQEGQRVLPKLYPNVTHILTVVNCGRFGLKIISCQRHVVLDRMGDGANMRLLIIGRISRKQVLRLGRTEWKWRSGFYLMKTKNDEPLHRSVACNYLEIYIWESHIVLRIRIIIEVHLPGWWCSTMRNGSGSSRNSRWRPKGNN